MQCKIELCEESKLKEWVYLFAHNVHTCRNITWGEENPRVAGEAALVIPTGWGDTYQKHLSRQLVLFSALWCHYFWSPCCLPCVSIYLSWLPLSITFPLQLLSGALCSHTTGGVSVVRLMQYPSTYHRQLRPSQHICPFKWNFLQTKSQLRIRLKSWALIWDLVVFGPLGHTKMTEDRGCSLCKDETSPKKTFSSSVDIKAQRAWSIFCVGIVNRFWVCVF